MYKCMPSLPSFDTLSKIVVASPTNKNLTRKTNKNKTKRNKTKTKNQPNKQTNKQRNKQTNKRAENEHGCLTWIASTP